MPDYDENGVHTHRYRGQYEPELQTDITLDFITRCGDAPWIIQLNWGVPHNASQNELYHKPGVFERMKKINRELNLELTEDQFDIRKAKFPGAVFPQHLVAPVVPQRYLDLYPLGEIVLDPDVEESKKAVVRHLYREDYALITSLDEQLGRIMKYLEENGRENIVLYTSDYGERLGSFGVYRSISCRQSSNSPGWRCRMICRVYR